jgi:hypothetical protein
MTVLHGEAALDFMFGDKWRELNAETERRDKAIADLLNVPCSQPACSGLACVNIDAPGGERAVCRPCADLFAKDDGDVDWSTEEEE